MTSLLGNPMAGDYLQEVSPNASNQVQIAVLNDVIRRLNKQLQTQTLSDGNNKRMLLGYQKDGWGSGKDFGIKISQPGIDVTSATDAQLIFKMDMATWRWYDTSGRNYVNIGNRSIGTYGFEMAKPGIALNDPT